jgi:hypothetical protein
MVSYQNDLGFSALCYFHGERPSGRPTPATQSLEVSLVSWLIRLLVIDDMALPKKGCHSVGVAPQHASALGHRPLRERRRAVSPNFRFPVARACAYW